MANKTLLEAINAILQRVSFTAGDAGAITSLTDSARQVAIDCAKQVINESIDELYSTTETPYPNEQSESTIVLVTGTRAYSLATDLVQLRWPFIDKTNTQFIAEYAGGYNALLLLDPEQDNTGLPNWGAIRPTDGKIHLDVAPDSTANGKTYTYQYDKDLSLTLSTSNVPFNNAVFRALVPAWAELWKREQRQTFDGDMVKAAFGRASRLLTQTQMREDWCPR